MEPKPPSYLQPYLSAIERQGPGFQSLLWASPKTQALRFNAIVRLKDLAGLSILDVGAGHADLLSYLTGHGIWPREYIGLEALPDFAAAARAKNLPRCKILDADFVKEPHRMFVGADVVIFCGSLNTLAKPVFYNTLRAAFEAASDCVIFNFLDSPKLAASTYLTWHHPADVLAFARQLSDNHQRIADYLSGDSTIAIRRNCT